MSYTIQNDWLRKDVLDSTAAGKVISGSHFYKDFVAIQNEFSNKAAKAGTATQTFQSLTPDVDDNTNKVATTEFVTTALNSDKLAQLTRDDDDTKSKIYRNQGDYEGSPRDELIIAARTDVTDSNGSPHNGSGITLYGNQDPKHPEGGIAVHTGGVGNLLVDKAGRVAVGNNLFAIMDEDDSSTTQGFQGVLNVFGPNDRPAIYLEGGNATTEGDITWKEGEDLSLGTWDSTAATGSEFTEKLKIKGNVDNYVLPRYYDMDFESTTDGEQSVDISAAGFTHVFGISIESDFEYNAIKKVWNGSFVIDRYNGESNQTVSIRILGM